VAELAADGIAHPLKTKTRRHDPASWRIRSCTPGFKEFYNVKTDTKHPQKAQSVSTLPLSPWRSVVVRPSTPAGRFVLRRFRVDPALADIVAGLAGLGSEVRS